MIYMYIYIYIYIYVYIYDIHVVLRFFDLRYKVNLTRDSNSRPSYYRSNALPNKLANLTQELPSRVNIYTRSDIEAQKLVPGC